MDIVPALTEEQIQKNADSITRLWDKAVRQAHESAIKIGARIQHYKDRMPHGSFERMFKDHPEAVATPIPFSARYGRMFMDIAAHPIISNRNHGSVLPQSARTLYELTRVPSAQLMKALEDGTVHPQMERADAIALQRDHGPRLPRAPRAPREGQNAKRAITAAVVDLFTRYPEERAYFVAEVMGMAKNFGMDLKSTTALMEELATRIKREYVPRLTQAQTEAAFKDVLADDDEDDEEEEVR